MDFARQGFPFFLVHFHANLIGERVDARIAVVSAIGSVGREALAEVEDDGGGVGSLAGREQTESAALGRFVRGIEDEKETGFDSPAPRMVTLQRGGA